MFNDEETKEIQKEYDKNIRNSKFSRTRRLMKDIIAIIIRFFILLIYTSLVYDNIRSNS